MKISPSVLAPLAALFFCGILLAGSAWELPSMQKNFSEREGDARTVDLIVQGLRCRGTSNFFMKIIGETPGVLSVSTFVQEHRATIQYDPSKIDPEGIAQRIDRPVRLPNGQSVAPFKVLEILR